MATTTEFWGKTFTNPEGNHFYVRNHQHSLNPIHYHVTEYTFEPTKLTASIQPSNCKQCQLTLGIQLIQEGIMHITVTADEKMHRFDLLKAVSPQIHYAPIKVIDKDAISFAFDDKSEFYTNIVFTLEKSPFRILIKNKGAVISTINAANCFNFERHRDKSDQNVYCDATKEFTNSQYLWEEMIEKQPIKEGPMSIGIDVSMNGKHAFGLGQRLGTFKVSNYGTPYRFYNSDHFFKVKTQSVYESFPWAIIPGPDCTQASLWMNASDTYAIPTKESDTINVHWMSECGQFNLFHFVVKDCSTLSSSLSKLIGEQRMPPLFSLGYHQCRWNYFNRIELLEVREKFKEYKLPLDTLWLDIEYSDKKKYMTWNSNFPNAGEMMDILGKEHQYLVCIVDPHISNDASYNVYNESNTKGYFIKEPNGNRYSGKCWAPLCSWLDYLNPLARKYWQSCFHYDNYPESRPNLYIWNDMNEPSVFDTLDVTTPKNLLYKDKQNERWK